jgi:hypothetical protein
MPDYPINDPGKQTYPRRVVKGLDLFLNVLVGGRIDETISSRCSKAALGGNAPAKALVWIFDLFQANHLYKAPEGDEVSAQEAIDDLEKNTDTTTPKV